MSGRRPASCLSVPASAPPANAMAAARLSVIIPARNEEQELGPTLARVFEARPWEVIVVDGQSADRTRAVARAHGAAVTACAPGRGRQLNAGAARAGGDVLLFLHADTLLPRSFERHVFRLLDQPGVSAGAFRLRIGAPSRTLRAIETLVNWRSRFLQLPYGDQAIFVKREMFFRCGGYPDQPAMEDFELVRRLRRLGRIAMAPEAVVTSARRWLECGVWRTTWLNLRSAAAYSLGVSPRRIAAWRRLKKPRCRDLSTEESSLPPSLPRSA